MCLHRFYFELLLFVHNRDSQTKKAFLVLAAMLYMYYAHVIGWLSFFGGICLLIAWHSFGAHNSGR